MNNSGSEHRAARALSVGGHLENGVVSLVMLFQFRCNYSLSVGRGLNKGPIIRGCWLQHAAHDQEGQPCWKVIEVAHRVKPCKLHSWLLAVILFSPFLSPPPPPFTPYCCCSLSPLQLPPRPSAVCSFLFHLSVAPSILFSVSRFVSFTSITADSWKASATSVLCRTCESSQLAATPTCLCQNRDGQRDSLLPNVQFSSFTSYVNLGWDFKHESGRSVLRSSKCSHFQLVRLWPDQSASLDRKEAGLWPGFSCDLNRKWLKACNQWWLQCGCCSAVSLTWTGQHFLRRRAKNGTFLCSWLALAGV